VLDSEISKSPELIEFFDTDKCEHVQEVVEPPMELPEDIEVTDITIPTTRTMSDHVLYQLDVVNSRKRRTFQKWTVLKRYVV
jgi:hypothetical protein